MKSISYTPAKSDVIIFVYNTGRWVKNKPYSSLLPVDRLNFPVGVWLIKK